MTQAGTRVGDTHRSLVAVARDYIRERIIAGEYAPGFRLKERDLSEAIGVSRIPIREALRDLATEGHIVLVQRRGAMVAGLDRNELRAIFEVREALEVQQAVLAARWASDAEARRLLAIAERADKAFHDGRRARMQQLHSEFHDMLLGACHNPLIASMLDPLQARLRWILRQHDDPTWICKEHLELAHAIVARDEDRARAAARAHIDTSRRLAGELLFPEHEAP